MDQDHLNNDQKQREFEEKIGATREYVYDAKTGRPISYTLKYGSGSGCLMVFLIALLFFVEK